MRHGKKKQVSFGRALTARLVVCMLVGLHTEDIAAVSLSGTLGCKVQEVRMIS